MSTVVKNLEYNTNCYQPEKNKISVIIFFFFLILFFFFFRWTFKNHVFKYFFSLFSSITTKKIATDSRLYHFGD